MVVHFPGRQGVKRFSSRRPVLTTVFLVCAAIGVYAWVANVRNASTVRAQETIEQVRPRRDSSGPQPQKFEWTSVQGADNYAMGIWDEADRLLFRADRIPDTFYEPPTEFQLAAGTYFWTVSAVRDGAEIASSGLSAFMIRTEP
jgi:hypothetical protein